MMYYHVHMLQRVHIAGHRGQLVFHEGLLIFIIAISLFLLLQLPFGQMHFANQPPKHLYLYLHKSHKPDSYVLRVTFYLRMPDFSQTFFIFFTLVFILPYLFALFIISLLRFNLFQHCKIFSFFDLEHVQDL